MHGILTLRTAALNVIRQVNRSKAALTAVALGVTAMMLAAGFIDWNLRFGRENTIHSQLGHIQIMKPRFLELGRSDPLSYVLPNREQDIKKILDGPGVLAVAPRLLISGLASSGETTLSFIGGRGGSRSRGRALIRAQVSRGAQSAARRGKHGGCRPRASG